MGAKWGWVYTSNGNTPVTSKSQITMSVKHGQTIIYTFNIKSYLVLILISIKVYKLNLLVVKRPQALSIK